MEPFQRFDESHLKHGTHFFSLLHWAKIGFHKSLENNARVSEVRRVCKCYEPLHYSKGKAKTNINFIELKTSM